MIVPTRMKANGNCNDAGFESQKIAFT